MYVDFAPEEYEDFIKVFRYHCFTLLYFHLHQSIDLIFSFYILFQLDLQVLLLILDYLLLCLDLSLLHLLDEIRISLFKQRSFRLFQQG